MSALPVTTDDLSATMQQLGARAREAAAVLATVPPGPKVEALRAAAAAIRARRAEIQAANDRDVAAAKARGLAGPMVERLTLTDARIEAMATGLEEIAALPDPIGTVIAEWTRPNGLRIQRVRVPLGVIGIIYESRPNVTADAGGLCLKSGNAAVLRGGSESFHSSHAIASCLAEGLRAAGLPEACIQLVPTTDRAAVGHMLTMREHIDVIVPRGGKTLIQRVAEESRIPVIKHLDGNCHVFVHARAELEKARRVVMNAKMRRTSICGAAETLLVDRAVADTHLAPLVKDLLDAGCAVRGDAAVRAVDPRVEPVTESDWDTEYLDAIIACGVVDGVDAAIAHVNRHGSHHTDAIVTEDEAAAERFLHRVDSGIVLWNASTQFADGGEFGMGAEIGISTDKFHARGPVGAEQLTSYKYVVRGTGQTRG
ncbi:glutamate-5-semialdehyde dehydrogenase [Azospirillum sp. RWY-5-1]|uniref:Gamma-glutamyl phosphate reductase n=1 Tax=Azospirillum oleiclasticum TaxID=2735135 RepID=A0ABX2T9K9_9PROT|nr:glutamate-5-semialdehyde dehydrogenase [Azospirillum oleiclasticum]NYZ13597.1 glutamate-5-semialdehyde dehydrogenase [Azospirillum oleiclasticum]NYZ20757.1 glutamate-5-semialdehyde dehydrogenase [Azospirillum oleiclasticum]